MDHAAWTGSVGVSPWLLVSGLWGWGLAYYPMIATLTIITITTTTVIIFMSTIPVGAITSSLFYKPEN